VNNRIGMTMHRGNVPRFTNDIEHPPSAATRHDSQAENDPRIQQKSALCAA
jgi:hypothetical protein